jgi:hypothetical protein
MTEIQGMLPSMQSGDLMLIRVSPTTFVVMRDEAVVEIRDHTTASQCADQWYAIAFSISQSTT